MKKPISFRPEDGNPVGRPKLRTAGIFMGEDHEFNNLQESAKPERRSTVERRKGSVAVLSIIFLLLLAAGSGQASPYAKYAGTTLVINFPNIAYYEYATKVIPEFTKETGIKVEIDKLEYMKMRDKQLLELSKPKGDYDLISYVIMWKTEYVSKGLLAPLAPFFTNPALAIRITTPATSFRHTSRRSARLEARKGISPARPPPCTGFPSGRKPACSPTGKTSSTSTAGRSPRPMTRCSRSAGS